MKVNLARAALTFSEAGPYKSLTEEQLASLVNGNVTTTGFTISSETASLICDLGARFRLFNIKYYRSPATSENISIFGRQGLDSGFFWEELHTVLFSDHVSVDLSSLPAKHRLIKIVHTVTSGSASVKELEIYSDDQHVLFGYPYTIEKLSVDSGTDILGVETAYILNTSGAEQVFYVALDADDVDSLGVDISLTSSGVFNPLYSTGLSIPDNYPWSSGYFDNTSVSLAGLTISSGTSGTYYTPVIDISSLDGQRLFWQSTVSGTEFIDEFGQIDSDVTIGVRLSDLSPTDVGWSSGALSSDLNWDINTGSIPFEVFDNNRILPKAYKNFFQAKVSFISGADGLTPVLHKIGIEEALSLIISNGSIGSIYVKSNLTDHVFGRESGLIFWFFESRNEEQ